MSDYLQFIDSIQEEIQGFKKAQAQAVKEVEER
jgi:hypothetical protein